MLVIVAERVLGHCGVPYRLSIDSVLSVIPNSGSLNETVIPRKRYLPVGKESGQTNHIERFNCTLRQRVSRLVRKTLSFSKKLENHIGAIWFFIHHYNASLPV